MNYAIVCDSTADLLLEELERFDVSMVPLVVTIDGEQYEDQVEISTSEFYERMAASKNLPSTSQPTPMRFAETFQKLFDSDVEQIMCINIAGVLSGTIESARLAASQFDKRIEVIDALGATALSGLLVMYATQLRNEGVSFDEALYCVRKAINDAEFLLACNSLEPLFAGGRMSAEEMTSAIALNVKPIFTFVETGALAVVGKARGMKGVVKHYFEFIQRLTEEKGDQMIRFCHTGNLDDVDRLKALLKENGIQYVDAGTTPAGAVVATHLGMGSLGIACLPA